MSSSSDDIIDRRLDCGRRTQDGEDLAGDIAFETPHDLRLGLALSESPPHVGLGGRMPAKPHDDDAVERGISLAITASIETMALSLARGGGDWVRPTQGCKGGLGAQTIWVIAGSDQQAGRPVRLDTEHVEQRRGRNRDQPVDLQLQGVDLPAQLEVSLSEQAEGVF